MLPLVAAGAQQVATGTASADQIAQWLTLMAHTGPAGLQRAVTQLDAYLAEYRDPKLATFYRAELLRGRLSAPAATALYRSAQASFCGDGAVATDGPTCAVIRWRLNQLRDAAPFGETAWTQPQPGNVDAAKSLSQNPGQPMSR